MSTPRVLVAGHITHDRHATGFSPGGCAFYAGEVYRQLGADVHLAVTVGTDFQFADILPAACTVTRGGATTVFANIYPPGHAPRLQLIEAAAPPVPVTGVPASFMRADIVHLAPVIGELDIGAWIAATKGSAQRARILAINVQGWVRRAGAPVDADDIAARAGAEVAGWARGHHVATAPWHVRPEQLAGVDVAFLSREDLDGQGDLLARLCRGIPLVAVTDGAKGCDLIARDASGATRKTRIGTYATDEIDATGAGDTFAAGMLYQLAQGVEPTEAARFGAAAASVLVEGQGVSTLHRVQEARERAGSVPILS